MKWVAVCACACVLGSQVQGQSRPRGPATAIELLDEVVVSGPDVRVSDLLPSNADAAERAAARDIDLGRAPELGSIRVFAAGEIARAAAGKLKIAIPPQISVRRGGWPLAPDQVRAALGRSGIDFRSDAVETGLSLPHGFLTRGKDARLEVLSVAPTWNASTAMARLRCLDRNDCGSFLVAIAKPITDPRIKANPFPPSNAGSEGHAQFRTPLKKSLVRPGRKALMVITDGGMRISLPVLPLKRAGMDESVRVLDPVAHRMFSARVQGENLLQSDVEEGR